MVALAILPPHPPLLDKILWDNGETQSQKISWVDFQFASWKINIISKYQDDQFFLCVWWDLKYHSLTLSPGERQAHY